MIAWSTLAAWAGRWATSIAASRSATSPRAPATISSPLRERSSRAAVTSAAIASSATLDGLGDVDDQPADAAREGRVDAAGELGQRRGVERAAGVELVDDVVEPLLADGEGSRLDDGAQSLGREHR